MFCNFCNLGIPEDHIQWGGMIVCVFLHGIVVYEDDIADVFFQVVILLFLNHVVSRKFVV